MNERISRDAPDDSLPHHGGAHLRRGLNRRSRCGRVVLLRLLLLLLLHLLQLLQLLLLLLLLLGSDGVVSELRGDVRLSSGTSTQFTFYES